MSDKITLTDEVISAHLFTVSAFHNASSFAADFAQKLYPWRAFDGLLETADVPFPIVIDVFHKAGACGYGLFAVVADLGGLRKLRFVGVRHIISL